MLDPCGAVLLDESDDGTAWRPHEFARFRVADIFT